MENFVKTSFELVNGNVNVTNKLMARSLVLFNDKGTAWNVVAKVRNTDKFSVVRALAKGRTCFDERGQHIELNRCCTREQKACN